MQPEPPLVWDTGKGLTARYRGRLLYSSVDPLRGVLRRLEDLVPTALPPRTLVLVASLGLGHGLAELVARVPDTCHILCVEADQPLFAQACRLAPRLFPDHPRLTVVRADDPAAVVRLVGGLGLHRFRRVLPVRLCATDPSDEPAYAAIEAAIAGAIRTHWQNRMTLIRMGGLWVRNLVANLAALPAAGDWTALADDRPIVVAGAGPSLEERLAWITGCRDRLRLLAVDTALPVLADAGLVPDIVFALEAQWVNLEDFLGARLDRCDVIADITATPSLLRRAPRLYLCCSRFAPLALLARLEAVGLSPTPIPALGSVGVAALHVALRLTTGPVLSTGLDFAYTHRSAHARGAPAMRAALAAADRLAPADSRLAGAFFGRRLLRVTDKRGQPATSDIVLQGYAGDAARVAAGGAGRVFDLDAGGLDKGAPQVSGVAPLAAWPPDPPRSAPGRTAAAAGPGGRWTAQAVRGFIEAERELLERLDPARAEEPDARTERLLADLDYLYVDFPDAATGPGSGRSFAGRLRRSAAAAGRWWARTEARLADQG
jgi:hypothetical protein